MNPFRRHAVAVEEPPAGPDPAEGAVPIAEIDWRQRARIAGRVRTLTVQPLAGVPTLECVLVDGTGSISVVFLGRRQIAGIGPGTRLVVEGMVGDHKGRLALVNPEYTLLPVTHVPA